MDLLALRAQVQQLIAEGKTSAAIDLLLKELKNDHPQYEEVLLLSARFNNLKQQDQIGQIPAKDYQAELTRINRSVIRLVNDEAFLVEQSVNENASDINTFRMSIARVRTLQLFHKNMDPTGLTMSDVYRQAGLPKRKEIVQAVQEMEKLELLSKVKVNKLTHYVLTEKGRMLINEYLHLGFLE